MRISVTALDKVSYVRNCEYWSCSPLQIAEELSTRIPATTPMKKGTAFHGILEDWTQYGTCLDGAVRTVEGETFQFKVNIEEEMSLPRIRELKGEKYYNILGVPVTLVGMCDAIHGRKVYDHKLTKKIDFDQYENSMQWRCYCEIFGADEVVFNLFHQYTGRDGIVNVRDLHQLNMFRYPGLSDDIRRALEYHVRFCMKYCPKLVEDDSLDRLQPF